ncbi:DUF5615 family PIN-like protein [Planctomicrobium piriforme]|uniref:DUF5615 family PIN-like protein n=1 Tax=Planctomicrobium piriforme TaxID=1576369 RepID=UPI000B84E5AD|nr:DUF5615 family PIN-like protein [Planctomicrobium piriforme]
MNWLVDAQLPDRVSYRLNELGHDAVRTRQLPQGNRTTDSELADLAASQNRILMTKDRDFLDSHLLSDTPPQLLWITTGNIGNDELLHLVESMLPQLEAAFTHSKCVEINLSGLTTH